MLSPRFKGAVLAFIIDEHQSLTALVTECGFHFEFKNEFKQASKCYFNGNKVTVVRPNPTSLMIELEAKSMRELGEFVHHVLQDFVKIGLHLYEYEE